MAADDENSFPPAPAPALNAPEEDSAKALDSEDMAVDAVPAVPPPIQSILPPVIPTAIPVVPPIAPIPSPPIAPPPVPRPTLAPVPIRPPVLRPPVVAQNGEARASDTDSDKDDSGAGGAEVEYEISEQSRLRREQQEKAKQEIQMKRRAAALAVPTNDAAVRARLRRLEEPITLFGEREMERRERLRMLMAKLDAEGKLDMLMKAHEDEQAAATATAEVLEEEILEYPFYTEGSEELRDARIDIAKFSISKAAFRLERARRKRDNPDEDEDAEIAFALDTAKTFVLDCSEIGDDRPLTGCSFSSDGKLLATWYLSNLP